MAAVAAENEPIVYYSHTALSGIAVHHADYIAHIPDVEISNMEILEWEFEGSGSV